MKQKKILIIGAGISGLALAINLQRMKIPYRIIEKQFSWEKKGLAMSIQGEGLKAASSLGILEEIKKQSRKRDLCRIENSKGTILKNIPINLNNTSFVIRRDVIHQALRSRIKKIEMGINVNNISEKSDTIKILFSDKSTDTFNMIIGADGINSKTMGYVTGYNKTTKINPAEYSGSALWGFTLPKFFKEIIEVWESKKMFAMYPVDKGTVFSFFMNVPENFYSQKKERKKYLQKHFSSFSNNIIKEVLQTLPDNIFFDKIKYSRPDHWSKGKVTLIGDACHSLSPLSGLGANLAMADAEGLAKIINMSKNNEDLLNRLNFFNSERKVEADKAYLLSKLRTNRSMLNFPGNIIRNRKMKSAGWTY